MNYNGPLYGKVGRRQIPLRLTSADVDRMEQRLQQLERENEWLREEIGRICGGISLEVAKQRIILVQNGTFPDPPFEQLGPVHTSFLFDQIPP